MQKIRVGIMGYGNVARGVQKAVTAAPDMELCAVFTRRDPSTLETGDKSVGVFSERDAYKYKEAIDVMILCGGSATDLETQGPRYAALFNTVDSFDNHAKIPDYIAAVNAAAKNTAAIVSTGWDPGLFSMLRALSGAILPDGAGYTFWGKGVSQGHSDAVRRIDGVLKAVQYTVPIDSVVEAVRSGARPELTAGEKHLRQCYVVAADNADKTAIETAIKTMPNYFADYNTTVNFIDENTFNREHAKMPHGGTVLYSGNTGENAHVIEYSLKLESNPEFTGSVMTAYARAAVKLAREGRFGASTVLDVPLSYLSYKERIELIRELL